VPFEYQPVLRGDLVILRPLRSDDYDDLYHVAADPLIWEQHPVPTRHEAGEFQAFFGRALASGGTLIAIDATGRDRDRGFTVSWLRRGGERGRDRLDFPGPVPLGRSLQRPAEAAHVGACLPLRESRGFFVSARRTCARSGRARRSALCARDRGPTPRAAQAFSTRSQPRHLAANHGRDGSVNRSLRGWPFRYSG